MVTGDRAAGYGNLRSIVFIITGTVTVDCTARFGTVVSNGGTCECQLRSLFDKDCTAVRRCRVLSEDRIGNRCLHSHQVNRTAGRCTVSCKLGVVNADRASIEHDRTATHSLIAAEYSRPMVSAVYGQAGFSVHQDCSAGIVIFAGSGFEVLEGGAFQNRQRAGIPCHSPAEVL